MLCLLIKRSNIRKNSGRTNYYLLLLVVQCILVSFLDHLCIILSLSLSSSRLGFPPGLYPCVRTPVLRDVQDTLICRSILYILNRFVVYHIVYGWIEN